MWESTLPVTNSCEVLSRHLARLMSQESSCVEPWLVRILSGACLAYAWYIGTISQTLTYPFDVLRRKMQVTGMKSGALGIRYTGAIDALLGILRTEGVAGLYRGLWPNLRKFETCNLAVSLSWYNSESGSKYSNLVFHVRIGKKLMIACILDWFGVG